jgi:tRNA pseudouridine38-40 synthase
MRTIKLLLEYDGTGYAGWQVQPKRDTIQGRLEAALETVTGEEVRVVGSGRTDAGVHAIGQVAHFKTESSLKAEEFRKALNSILPRDIAVREATEEAEGFHARFSAKRKLYRYAVLQVETRSAFSHRYSWDVGYAMDTLSMNRAARYMLGTHDFSAFRAASCTAKNPTKTIYRLEVHERGDDIVFLIEADGFLKHMARTIVGTLVEVGRGYLRSESVKEVLESRDWARAGPTAPPQGLFLLEVTY